MAKLRYPEIVDFELIVKMMGGHMMYLADLGAWQVTLSAADGKVVQVAILEHTPLENACATLRLAYAASTL